MRRWRRDRSLAASARRLVRDLELGAELTSGEWPTAAVVRGTADHLSRLGDEEARVWYAAAELLEARAGVVG